MFFEKKFKGKRIRQGDENLTVQFALVFFIICFLSLFLFFNMCGVRAFVKSGYSFKSLSVFFSRYSLVTAIIALAGSTAIYFCLYYFKGTYFKELKIRQMLAKMILDNNLYDVSADNKGSFFKDVSFSEKKRITFFPKIYYRRIESLVVIQVEIAMKSYQDQLLSLEKKFETGLFCEVISKELKDGLVEYTLLCDILNNRISIDEVEAKDGSLKLMKNVYWKYDKLPHMLICGGTGSGKSYFILTLIECLLRSNAKLTILDPKNADLADLGTVMPNVYYKKEDMVEQINKFCEDMLERSGAMKTMEGYKTGENYAYLGLSPHFLIFDEYVAFMEMLGNKESFEVLSKLKQIVMLGRQAGYFLIVACQRPDAKYFGEGIRDQFNFRVALGRMSEVGYGMMFGETNKDFYFKEIKGRGYLDNSTSVITEFYAPKVQEGHDFLKTIEELHKKRQV